MKNKKEIFTGVHMYYIEDAEKFGPLQSIILFHIKYWLNKNKKAGINKRISKANGLEYYWVYSGAPKFIEYFPYLNKRSVNRWLRELELGGAIIIENHNKFKYDRTQWFTTNDYLVNPSDIDKLYIPKTGNEKDDLSHPNDNLSHEKRQVVPPIPIINLKESLLLNNKETVLPELLDRNEEKELSKNIVTLLAVFKIINPTINFGQKTFRKAAEDLIKQFGLVESLNTANYAISVQGKPYAPTIVNPYQLKNKMGELNVYKLRQENPVTGGYGTTVFG